MSDESNEGRYEYTTSGGCSRCDAYDGYHDENPGRPHPHCNCDIADRKASGSDCPSWTVAHTGNDRDPPDNNLTIHGRVDVRCCIMGSSSEEFSVEFDDPNPDDWEGEFLAAAEAVADRLMADCDLIS